MFVRNCYNKDLVFYCVSFNYLSLINKCQYNPPPAKKKA